MENENAGDIFDAIFGFNETLISLHHLIPSSAHSSLRAADRKWRLEVIAKAFQGDREDDFQGLLKKFAANKLSREEARAELVEIIGKGSTNASFELSLKQLILRPEPTAVVHRATLMVMVSAFESLISSIVEVFMRQNPLQAPIQEKEFSLAELIAANDLDEIIENALTKRVENILRGGLASWTKWFEEQGLVLQNLCINWDEVAEIFERRHAYVHTGGKVNPSYKHKVAGAGPIGNLLPLDEQYLHSSLGHIVCLGNLIATRFLPKTKKNMSALAVSGTSILYFDELMKLDQWAAIQKMANTIKNDEMELDVKLEVRCFEWLAAKQLHDLKKIEQQIRSWDTSALKSKHAFKKAALLEDVDEMQDVLSAAHAANESWVTSIEDMPEVQYQENIQASVSRIMSELRDH
ncbi:hypothetical protein [Actinomadura sp. 7K507]|uniref:hypothetical protein n=1 Tax=Actinomadura sp. 7K507 TaxID=2530365 RepID=UPI00104905F8|nr:hypothetical protein [Actinomadura sp. 7K507]TDC96015.1 hypothetical protein E1285_06230 [Actinomadura sp. 7K507]